MIIVVENEEEKKIIIGVTDVILKTGGVQNLQAANLILASIKPSEVMPEKAVEEEKEEINE